MTWIKPNWYGIRPDLDLYWWGDDQKLFHLTQNGNLVVLDDMEARCLIDLLKKILEHDWKPNEESEVEKK